MRSRSALGVIATVGVAGVMSLAAACGSSDDADVAAPTAEPTVGSTDLATSTSAGDTGGSAPPTGAADRAGRPTGQLGTESFRSTWLTPDGESWALDVVAPVEQVDGGWPVLVAFHGAAPGTSAGELTPIARAGVVVVGPRWIDPSWSTSNLMVVSPDSYVDGELFDVARCALAAAQEAAEAHGGDVTRTFVDGFSAGVHPAAWVALGVERDDPCPDADIVPPVGLVLGDSQMLFHGFDGEWDAAFEDPTSNAVDTVARFVDPERWSVPAGFTAYLWSTDSTGVDRAVDDPPAADSWIRARGGPDADALVADLATVGAFDDGVIGFDDDGRLLELRMRRDGVPVLHEHVTSDHARTPETTERTIDLVWGDLDDGS